MFDAIVLTFVDNTCVNSEFCVNSVLVALLVTDLIKVSRSVQN